ncbi:DUF4123 domain-containing protein [Pseudomonas sp. PD9R]|uniref:DUF4123 domain-containing protein n=1 Tax=Pseudomonas sp. PD9R TaxID=2853534 RepID=UPI001C443672|nr:DUF4123 domain-containing protein [Pseudomonas sp. PD9R]MBV6826029.1 DUF4123 domain-containing protein [Pseudomonas sp. PD9R]
MMIDTPRQWMADQLKLDRWPCLILDSEGERDARQAFLENFDLERYRGVYSDTQVTELADAGPFIFILDNPQDPRLNPLFKVPERNWGWLASIQKNDLPVLVQHWRDRLIIGTRPNQGLYRFHDNCVLTRALAHLPAQALPAYLGPTISACYWQGSQWDVTENPAPGQYPAPAEPAWLNIPSPMSQSIDMRLTNVYRHLLAEHSDAMASLCAAQEPKVWLEKRILQAHAWGWHAPEQAHFLVLLELYKTKPPIISHWQPRERETPLAHFERLFDEVKFWSGEQPI